MHGGKIKQRKIGKNTFIIELVMTKFL